MSRTLSDVLGAASIEELHQLRDIVLSADKLSTDDLIKGDYTDPAIDGPYLASEIRKFGGNTFANIVRDDGPPYKEVVTDVADKMKANYRKGASVEELETAIINTVLGNAWEKMSTAEREALIAECKLSGKSGKSGKAWMAGGSAAALQAAFKAGGFASYKLLVVVVNGMVRKAIGVGLASSGLSLATNAMLTRTAAIIVGPIGWAITGIITAIQVAGPSYKVTIPCAVYIAYLRKIQESVQCDKCEAILSPSEFCSECGAKLPSEGNGKKKKKSTKTSKQPSNGAE